MCILRKRLKIEIFNIILEKMYTARYSVLASRRF